MENIVRKVRQMHDEACEVQTQGEIKPEDNKVQGIQGQSSEQCHKLTSQGRSQEACLSYETKDTRSSEQKKL